MIGVVACEALYNAVGRLAPDATVRYVPPDRHEFPVNVPDETAVASALQRRIDAVDDPALDRIVVAYADDGESLVGLRSAHAPLVVARSTDCISTFLPAEPSNAGSDAASNGTSNAASNGTPKTASDAAGVAAGERKAPGTYYLSRGWIDCAVDACKLHAAYTGTERELLEPLERAAAAHPDMRVTWNEGPLYERALEAREGVGPDQIGRFVHRIVRYYDTVALLDTGDLYEAHREYAERFRAFVERLSREHGDGHRVELATVDADHALLRTLLRPDPDAVASDRVESYPPGSPVR